MNRRFKPEHGIIAVALLGVILVIALPFLSVHMPGRAEATQPPTENPNPPKVSACQQMKDNANFMAYDADTKPNNFGPAVRQRKVREVVREFDSRLRQDPALTSVEAAYLHVKGFTLREYRANTLRLQSNCHLWKQTIRKIDRRLAVAKLSIVKSDRSYHTLWFTPGANDKVVPGLRQGTIPAKFSVVLKIVMPNGKVYMLRLECGFQPFAPHFPPSVPPMSPPHKTPPGNGGCVGSQCHQPPGCTHNCKPPKDCHCVKPTQVSQPPLPPPAQPSTVPSHAPSPNPTHPANTSSPGPPNNGGNNGGSTQQPGQSGSPDPGVPSDDPTATGDPGGF